MGVQLGVWSYCSVEKAELAKHIWEPSYNPFFTYYQKVKYLQREKVEGPGPQPAESEYNRQEGGG